MEFRSQKAIGALLASLVWLAPAVQARQELRYEVRHVRFGKDRTGTLLVEETGISFEETAKKKPHVWHWEYQDIQQLKIAPKSLTLLTYRDNKWKLGADRQYEFRLEAEQTFEDAYRLLRDRLDQRFVAAIPDQQTAVLWEIPVKHLLRFGGSDGVLQVGRGQIVYKSLQKDESRTWRYQDIENISASGPFQLTITTFERAKTHYGNLKGFNFQLKQRLEEDRYNDLWLRLNQSKGLKIFSSYREGAGAP